MANGGAGQDGALDCVTNLVNALNDVVGRGSGNRLFVVTGYLRYAIKILTANRDANNKLGEVVPILRDSFGQGR